MVLLMGGMGLTLIRLSQGETPLPPEPKQFAPPPPLPKTLGSEQAKVAVYAYLPLGEECVRDIVDYLLWLGETYPHHVFIGLVPLTSPLPESAPDDPADQIQFQGRLLRDWVDVDEKPGGLYCAYIRINGRLVFQLPEGENEEPRKIVLTGPVDEVFRVADFQAALEQVLAEQYEELPGPLIVPPETYQGKMEEVLERNQG